MTYDYDLLVIGAGPGGLAASEAAAQYGARVAIAEQSRVGGTCVIQGCIPEKIMAYAAHFAQLCRDATGYGWSHVQGTFDWQHFMQIKDQEVSRLSQVHLDHLQSAGIDLITGHVALVNAHTAEVADQQITADKILIATGSKTFKPDIPGIEYAIAPPELFQLEQQPEHVAIVGCDYLGVKLAGILKELGSQVTQITPEPHILTDFDQDLGCAVQSQMSDRGIQTLGKTTVKEIALVEGRLQLALAGEHTNPLTVDTVIYTLGRMPNLEGLNLERVGVKTVPCHNNCADAQAILVDAYNRTSQPNIFAVGDCTNRFYWTPVAIAEARAFAETEFHHNPQTVGYEYIPFTVSEFPEAATVGMTEAQAREKLGEDVHCYQTQFRPLFFNLAKRNQQALLKLVVDAQTERVLGIHMVGEGAIEIVQCLEVALRLGATKKDFDATIGIHPSVAEEFFTLRDRR